MAGNFAAILEKIRPQFEVIHPGLNNPNEQWAASKYANLALPVDLLEFLKLANGMCRIRNDEYFAFRLYSLDQYLLYAEFNHLEGDEAESTYCTELKAGDNANDLIVFGSEGEYGIYTINCNPNSLHYGHVCCIIVNIPERTGEWENFQEFLHGIVDYCDENPLPKYRQFYITSEPTYNSKINQDTPIASQKFDPTPYFLLYGKDTYHGVPMNRGDAEVLYALEQQVGEELPIIPNVEGYYLGYQISDKRVTGLCIVAKNLSYIPDNIENLSALTMLYLPNNEIRYLPASIGNLIALKVMILGSNDLRQLTPSIGKLQSLECLAVNSNSLVFLPTEIGDLQNLKQLKIGENQLSELPPSIGNLKTLAILDCCFNLLTSIPETIIDQCLNLEELLVYDNSITHLPTNLNRLKNLRILTISSNPIENFPETIVALKKLNHLNFYGTKIISIAEPIEKWLDELKASGCEIHPQNLEDNFPN